MNDRARKLLQLVLCRNEVERRGENSLGKRLGERTEKFLMSRIVTAHFCRVQQAHSRRHVEGIDFSQLQCCRKLCETGAWRYFSVSKWMGGELVACADR